MDKDATRTPPERPIDPPPRDDVLVALHRCPFCHDDVRADGGGWVACAACLARHHEACWAEGGRCATCRHEVVLRSERKAPKASRAAAVTSALVAAGLAAVLAAGAVLYQRARVESDRNRVRALEAERQELDLARSAQRQALEDARALATRAMQAEAERERLGPPPVPDARFDLARRVDALRALNRRGAREDARSGRRRAAAKEAIVQAALEASTGGPDAARLRQAREALERRYPPPRPRGDDAPVESILDSQDDYLMPPRPDHPELAGFLEKQGKSRATALPAYAAYLAVLAGDPQGGLTRANGALDRTVDDWMAWYARGSAQLALGDARGAWLSFTLCEAFSSADPTWALVGQLEAAAARGDVRAELRAAWDALEVGRVPDWGGHHEALLERIARLEEALGEPRRE
jgi:hypothetical protein